MANIFDKDCTLIGRFLNAYVVYPAAERWLGRNIRSKLRVLLRDFSQDYSRRKKRQREQLCRILRTAGEEVPYYRDLFQRIGFDPSRVLDSPEYLQELPYLTKDIIRREGDRLISERFQKQQLHERKTGGSTGPSAKIYYSQEALDWTAAVNLMVLQWAGKNPHTKEVHLASRFPERFPLRDRIKEHVKCAALNRVNIFTSSLDEEGLEDVLRRLRRNRSYLIQGHPSTLYALAGHASRRGSDAKGLFQVFESTGETISERKRETIERVFGCRVINRYGNAEFGVVAYQLHDHERDRLPVLDFVVWPESAETSGGGKELVLTGLTNPSMPLIRYRTGDHAEVVESSHGAFLTHLIGRVHDMVRIGSTVYPTHYLQDLLDRLDGIVEFQIVEADHPSPVLRLVPEPHANRETIESRILSWWGREVRVEFVGFEGLTRQGRLGKFRHVVRQ